MCTGLRRTRTFSVFFHRTLPSPSALSPDGQEKLLRNTWSPHSVSCHFLVIRDRHYCSFRPWLARVACPHHLRGWMRRGRPGRARKGTSPGRLGILRRVSDSFPLRQSPRPGCRFMRECSDARTQSPQLPRPSGVAPTVNGTLSL